MGTILKFVPAEQEAAGAKSGSGPKKSGEIIIFPGVRYDNGARTKASCMAAGKRDYLEL